MLRPGATPILLLLSLLLRTISGNAQGVITTVAGTDFLFTAGGAPARQAPLGGVSAVAVDSRGNLFLTASTYGMILRVTAGGVLEVVAGNGIRAFSGDGGEATNASLFSPWGIAVDAAGNIFIADTGNHRIRKVSPDGIISTVAGSGVRGSSGDGGPATAASLNEPNGVALDSGGNLYIADTANHRIRKVTPGGIISTVAGTGRPGLIGDGGPATQASLEKPYDVAVGPSGILYIADTYNHAIRRVSPEGVLSTIAGVGFFGFSGDGGPAVDAALQFPEGVHVDAGGNVYISDTQNHRIRRIGANGIITTIAGSGPTGFDAGGFQGDGGPATRALLNGPQKAVVDAAGNLYIADFFNRRVRRVAPDGTISTFAGNGIGSFFGDGGPATSASIDGPFGVALDGRGNLFVADTLNQRIRRVAADGTITTVAGNGEAGFSGDNGPATQAAFSLPAGVAVDAAGNLYVADVNNGRIRKVTPAGIITTVAGNGGLDLGGDGGPATRTSLFAPFGVAVDASNNLYIAEAAAGRIRRVAPDGIISTVAGKLATGAGGFDSDGRRATDALLNGPAAVAIGPDGLLYIADQNNHRIRRVSRDGIISTVAGNGERGFSGDGGPATNASLAFPRGIRFDAAGNFYIADRGNLRIRKIAPTGIITTVAGGAPSGPPGDGGPAIGAYLDNPQDVAVDAAGNVYIADSGNDRIRAVLAVPPSFSVAPGALSFTAEGRPPAARGIAVVGSVPSLPFSATVSTTRGGGWLSATPSSGAMPAVVRIAVDAGLAVGEYQGTVIITAPNASPAVRMVNVALRVSEGAPPPRLAVDPDNLSFTFTRGSPPQTQTLTVSGAAEFAAVASTTSGGPWLSVSPAAGRGSALLSVRADPSGVGAGTYLGSVTVTSAAETVTIPVTMAVNQIDQTILLSQRGLTFTAVLGGSAVPPQSFAVLNVGSGVMSWSASAVTAAGGPNWLSVRPSSGSSDAASPRIPWVEVTVDPRGLAPGEYYGFVRVSGSRTRVANTPQDVPVVLEVLPAGSNPGPLVQPSELIFTGVAGGASPGSQTVLVYNLTRSPLTYRSTSDPWLTRLPPDGTISPDRPAPIVVQPDPSNLPAGVRQGNLTLQFSDGSVRNIRVLLVLPQGPAAGQRGGVVAQGACIPSSLIPAFTTISAGFSVRPGWPVPLEVRVLDDCGNRMNAGSVVTTFSNGDPPLPMVSVGEGRWSGTWQARNAQLSEVSISVAAQLPGTRLQGVAEVTGGLRANANPPAVNPGGVVSAASFASRAPLAPGSLISIFGSKLSEAPAQSTRLPLETQLAGAQVVLAGETLPLLFASDGQINAMIPYGITVNTRHQLVARRGSSYALPEFVSVAPAQPAIFTRDLTGKGQGVIVDVSNRYVDTANPAKAGDALVIYCTGLGEVDPPVTAGARAPADPLSRTVNQVSVTVGGAPAEVFFSGLAPGFAGLYQVNAFVPQGAPTGDEVPVVVSVAGQASPPVTIALR
jgi:uncharacterized protein (TIGR03437 family)